MRSAHFAVNRARRQAGLTLIETCTTLAIASALTGLAAPGFIDQLTRRQLEGVAAEVLHDIAFVRSQAVARNRPLRISFQSPTGGSCYVIHTGAAGQCVCANDGVAQCSGDATQLKTVYRPMSSNAAVHANVASMLFDPVRGTTSPAGTVRIEGPAGAIHHRVNIMGRPRSCSPNAAVRGYKAC